MTTRLIGARISGNEDPRLLRGLGCLVAGLDPVDVAVGRTLEVTP